MKTVIFLESRRENWHSLERLCDELESRRRRRLPSAALTRFATLYRAACADLALADAAQLPPGTVDYLNQLVGRAHNQLYRSGRFQLAAWRETIFVDLPRQLFTDRTLWLAMALFWGIFFATMALGAASPAFVQEVLGDGAKAFEQSFANGFGNRSSNDDMFMAGFYIHHNTSIGLQCFAYGLVFGVGGLFVTAFNAAYIGTVFGHMMTTPQRDNFLTFVTAHGPCELTAIVLCAAAGLRLGFSLIRTGGLSRAASVRAAGKQSLPVISLAMLLFFCAAMIEGFLSPSRAPYWVKAFVAVFTGLMIFGYIVVLGFVRNRQYAAR
jgi:uncharacterized membrane protein SpoIIM required for sporulation